MTWLPGQAHLHHYIFMSRVQVPEPFLLKACMLCYILSKSSLARTLMTQLSTVYQSWCPLILTNF